MSTIGSSTLVVTLSPASPRVTLDGTIAAYGPAGTFDGVIPIDAAVYGPGSAHFNIQNKGTIISTGTSHVDFGIALLASGTVTNTGGVTGVNGIGILNTTGSSYIDNSGAIAGTLGDGIDLFGAAAVMNAKGGKITGSDNGVTGENVTYVYNYGGISGGGQGVAIAAGAAYNSGIISGGTFGVNAASGAVYNYKSGLIAATAASTAAVGVALDSGSVYNTGSITGYTGIRAGIIGASGAAVMIYNDGKVTGTETGIILNQAGTIDNAGKVIATTGIYLEAGRLDNSGTITGTGTFSVGVRAQDGTRVDNAKDGVITGAVGVLLVSASLTNAGSIGAALGGVVAEVDSTVINTGTITGGVMVEAGGTLIDTGYIAGPSFAVEFIDGSDASGTDDRLIIDAAATLTGDIYLSSGALEIEADGSKTATINAAQLGGLGTLSIDSKAILDIAGTYAVTGTVTNAGTIREAKGDALTISGAITGTGVIALGPKTALALNGAVGAKQVIDFTGTGETLELGAPGSFAGKIETFAAGDTIALAGISPDSLKSLAFGGGILTIATTLGTDHLTFASPAAFKGDIFASFTDGAGIGITLSAAAKMQFAQPEAVSLASPTALADAKPTYPTQIAPPLPTAAQRGWLAVDLLQQSTLSPPITLHS